MKLEHYPVEKLRREIISLVGNHINLKEYRVFFFGSRVIGQSRERSDIDVGIEGARPIPWHQLAKIKAGLEDLPTLYTVDVVDFGRVSPGFKKVARAREYVSPRQVP